MTNAQKWIAAFLGLFLLLLFLGRITKKENSNENIQQTEITSNDKSIDAFEMIKRTGCTNCHGSDLKGTTIAPKLTGLKEYWNKEKLIGYLRNPSSYESDSRFVEYKKKYKNIVMPSYNNIDVKELGKIADYLLGE